MKKSDLMRTSSEPEDWEGFRRLVRASELAHRMELLDIAENDSLNPDEKRRRIKRRFPQDYRSHSARS